MLRWKNRWHAWHYQRPQLAAVLLQQSNFPATQYCKGDRVDVNLEQETHFNLMAKSGATVTDKSATDFSKFSDASGRVKASAQGWWRCRRIHHEVPYCLNDLVLYISSMLSETMRWRWLLHNAASAWPLGRSASGTSFVAAKFQTWWVKLAGWERNELHSADMSFPSGKCGYLSCVSTFVQCWFLGNRKPDRTQKK